MSCDYCAGSCQHDSDAEGAIDWYQHYMSVPAADLAADYAMSAESNDEVSTAKRMAFEARKDEIRQKWVDAEL